MHEIGSLSDFGAQPFHAPAGAEMAGLLPLDRDWTGGGRGLGEGQQAVFFFP